PNRARPPLSSGRPLWPRPWPASRCAPRSTRSLPASASSARKSMMPRPPAKPPHERRRAAERQGHRGEGLAALYLQAKFYAIRDRRFKTPMGEIDIVAERAGTVVFVEVKARARGADEHLIFAAINRRR